MARKSYATKMDQLENAQADTTHRLTQAAEALAAFTASMEELGLEDEDLMDAFNGLHDVTSSINQLMSLVARSATTKRPGYKPVPAATAALVAANID